jgi:hypothetical protein
MRKSLQMLIAVGLSVVWGSSAWAQATRTWVSGVGDDANPCSRTAPCKTFAGAISKTAAGGEIDALDPGGFGAVTITKSISIDGRGTLASVLVSASNGIAVAAGPNDVVILRGLSINGIGLASNGVRFISGKALHVEDCTITGFMNVGIDFEPAAASAQLFVKGSTISQNTVGNMVISQGNAVVENSQFLNAPYGLNVTGTGTAQVSVHDTTFSGHSGIAIHAAGASEISVEHGLVANNGVGVQGDSTVRLSEVMVSNNATGITGTVASFGNNRMAAGNATNGAPSSVIAQQ